MTLSKEKNLKCLTDEEMQQVSGGGQIGIRIFLSKEIRDLGGIGAFGATAGGMEVALKELNLIAPPWGAIAAGAISAIAGGLVQMAVEKNWQYVDILQPCHGADLIREIHV